jgi:hypothetical protein
MDRLDRQHHPAFDQPLRTYHARFASAQLDALKNQTASSGSTLGGGCSFLAEHMANCVPFAFCQPTNISAGFFSVCL